MKPTAADLQAIFGLKPKDAIIYLKRKGFAITWNWQQADAAAHARAFTIAKMTQFDLLKDTRQALIDAMDNGTTLKDFVQDLAPKLKSKGWWGKTVYVDSAGDAQMVQLGSHRRLRTIYQTNLQAAFMAGRYKAAKEAAFTHPYWQYIAVMDGRTRASHAALHNKVYRHDDPIWDHITPPNGFNCRCRFTALSDEHLQQRGLAVESSAGKLQTEEIEAGVDKRTGEIYYLPQTTVKVGNKLFKTDLGFSGSPLQSHLMDELLLDKATAALGQEAALVEVQKILLNPIRLAAWHAFIDTAQQHSGARGQTMAFGVINKLEQDFVAKQGIEVNSGVIFMHDKLLAGKKAIRHGVAGNALSAAELKQLPQLMAKAEQVLWDVKNQTLLYILYDAGSKKTKLAVRFGRFNLNGKTATDAATVFKVDYEAITDAIEKQQYIKIK